MWRWSEPDEIMDFKVMSFVRPGDMVDMSGELWLSPLLLVSASSFNVQNFELSIYSAKFMPHRSLPGSECHLVTAGSVQRLYFEEQPFNQVLSTP